MFFCCCWSWCRGSARPFTKLWSGSKKAASDASSITQRHPLQATSRDSTVEWIWMAWKNHYNNVDATSDFFWHNVNCFILLSPSHCSQCYKGFTGLHLQVCFLNHLLPQVLSTLKLSCFSAKVKTSISILYLTIRGVKIDIQNRPVFTDL